MLNEDNGDMCECRVGGEGMTVTNKYEITYFLRMKEIKQTMKEIISVFRMSQETCDRGHVHCVDKN